MSMNLPKLIVVFAALISIIIIVIVITVQRHSHLIKAQLVDR